MQKPPSHPCREPWGEGGRFVDPADRPGIVYPQEKELLPPPQPPDVEAATPPLPQQFEEKVEKTFFVRPFPHLVQTPPPSSALFPALYRSKE
jgi:hypothetical protein